MSFDRFSRNGTESHPKGKSSLSERDGHANETLATRYDKLSQLWVDAEKKLKALKPPCPVWIDYGHEWIDPTGPSPKRWHLLALTKFDGKWRICHATSNETNDDGSVF